MRRDIGAWVAIVVLLAYNRVSGMGRAARAFVRALGLGKFWGYQARPGGACRGKSRRPSSAFPDRARGGESWLLLLLLALLGLLWPGPSLGEEALAPDAKAVILIEGETGRTLYARNADEPLPMASTTKCMTALLALERCRLDEVVAVGANASGVTGTSMYLSVGERLTVEQLLYGMLLRSGNDAAVAVAEHIAGDVESFAQLMDARARELEARATFRNPHGLDAEGHAASARGMAKIAREALKNAEFRRLVATQRAVVPWPGREYDRVLTNKNKLLRTYAGATGVKTGFTNKAGRCLVFSAAREGRELIGVVLNCPDWFADAAALLDWGFANLRDVTVCRAGTVLATVPVLSGEAQVARAVTKEALVVPLLPGEEAELRLELPSQLSAPVERGATIGRVLAVVNGESVCAGELVAERAVGEWGYLPALRRVARFWPLNGAGTF